MTATTTVEQVAGEAARLADAAGVRVVVLESMDELTAAMNTFRSIWGFDEGQAPISAELLPRHVVRRRLHLGGVRR